MLKDKAFYENYSNNEDRKIAKWSEKNSNKWHLLQNDKWWRN